MSKYRLIKKYPGSPELGTVVTFYTNWGMYGILQNCLYKKEIIENQPEFWVEIKKDYEILSFKQDSNCNDLWTKFPNGWCKNLNGDSVTSPYTYEEILNNHLKNGVKYYIHSIKRLSDGEVFSVGDKIEHYAEYKRGEFSIRNHIVEKIYFIEKDRLAFYVGNGLNLGIKDISNIKKPLFKTEDNSDIHPGDNYWCVNTAPHLWSIFQQTANENTKLNKGVLAFKDVNLAQRYIDKNKKLFTTEDGVDIFEGTSPKVYIVHRVNDFSIKECVKKEVKSGSFSDKMYYFSRKENAEKYILMNKPCLSINDIINLAHYNQDDDLIISKENLENIVKDKIK